MTVFPLFCTPKVPDAFRRSEDGKKAIKQQMKQLFRLAESLFPDRPLVKADGSFALKDLHALTFKEIVSRAPAYFSTLYRRFRGKEYEHKVYARFEDIYTQLNSSPPVRSAWVFLLKEIPKGSLPALGSSKDSKGKK